MERLWEAGLWCEGRLGKGTGGEWVKGGSGGCSRRDDLFRPVPGWDHSFDLSAPGPLRD